MLVVQAAQMRDANALSAFEDFYNFISLTLLTALVSNFFSKRLSLCQQSWISNQELRSLILIQTANEGPMLL